MAVREIRILKPWVSIGSKQAVEIHPEVSFVSGDW
jgi:hypothetical protein